VAEEQDNQEERDEDFQDDGVQSNDEKVIRVSGMYREWFLDYASYVILERAVPHINDGLKPVQRRILHSMRELEDGRYNKVANVVGNTMKYHPHGDASITDAMVGLGQKELLIDTQGNWGNTLTGDRAAAARYIEARLSKFALEVAFNPKTTKWLLSYDGRNQEPVTLPMKFPLLLAQGVEGIAVGLSCKMLPHNFIELIDASVKILNGVKPKIYPDFSTGGYVDVSNYNDGQRGGRVRVRAKIEVDDKKTLRITQVPFGTTTGSLIDSILKANDKGKIKIKKIEDNTGEHVEILVHLPPNVSPDKMIDALYAFTDCENSLSPNAVIIEDDKPRFVGVSEILQRSTEQTKALLKLELEIRKRELQEEWHFASLEKIFIEEKIYIDFDGKTYEEAIEVTHDRLKPFVKNLVREVTDDDVKKLLEIRMRRITKHDADKADTHIHKLEDELKDVQHNLDNITDFAIAYYKELKRKYGEGRERKCEIRSFDTIDRTKVVVNNAKLYVDRKEGFAGTGLKRTQAEFVADCSDIDDIIVIRKDGKMVVSRISDKAFFGKDIEHIAVWKKGDKRTIYNVIYFDGGKGYAMVKRFAVSSITRDREYDLTTGEKNSKLLYITANRNGEAEVIRVVLRPKPKLRTLRFDFDFSDVSIKSRTAKGNILTKNLVQKIELKEAGASTLAAQKIYWDPSVRRLNNEGRGELLGAFKGDDKIVTVTSNGEYKMSPYALSTKFEDSIVLMERFDPEKVFTVVYFDGEKEQHNVKRFVFEPVDKLTPLITEDTKSVLKVITAIKSPVITLKFDKRSNDREDEELQLAEFIDVKGIKAKGNRLSPYKVKTVVLHDPPEDSGEDDNNEEPPTNDGGGSDISNEPAKPVEKAANVSVESKDSKPPKAKPEPKLAEPKKAAPTKVEENKVVEKTDKPVETKKETEAPKPKPAPPKRAPKKDDDDFSGGQITLEL